MKIGWVRLTMLLEIDLNVATVGFSGMRTGYMRSLTDQGHTIKLLTKLSQKSEASYQHVKDGKDVVELGSWDCSWFDSLEYEPAGLADDCDLLIVECTACNWMFNTNGEKAIRRCVNVLDSFKGKVIIEQSDPELPFPFGKLAGTEYPYSHEENPYRLGTETGHKNLEAFGWADPSEIWDEKEYFVCTRAESPQHILDDRMANGIRFQYGNFEKRGNIKIVSMPQTYDFENHNTSIVDGEENKYDFIYTGYPRTDKRESKFDELFVGTHEGMHLNRAVCGPWDKSKREHKKYDLTSNCIDFVGNLPWAELPAFISSSKFTLYLGVNKAYRMNWQTNKPFETISSGSVLLYDDIKYLREWFGDRFMIDIDNAGKWHHLMSHITDGELAILKKFQLKVIRDRDWKLYTGVLADTIECSDLSAPKQLPALPKTKKLEAKCDVIIKGYFDEYAQAERSIMDSVALEAKKYNYDQEAVKLYDEPECMGTYDESYDQCKHVCPFSTLCRTPKAEPEDPEADQTTADTEPVIKHPQADDMVLAEAVEIPETEPGSITITGERSTVVIMPTNGKDLTITLDGCTIQINTKA